MDIKNLLLMAIPVLLLLAFILYVAYVLVERKAASQHVGDNDNFLFPELKQRENRLRLKRRWNEFLDQSYEKGSRIPFLKKYIFKIRSKVSGMYAFDQLAIRRQTMKIVFSTFALIAGCTLLMALFSQDILYVFIILFFGVVINGFLIGVLVRRVELKLLRGIPDFFKDVRHYYQQHGMVAEAINDACENGQYMVAKHGKKIVEILNSNDQEKEFEKYNQAAPNRFLKIFAGLSYSTQEHGDIKDEKGSHFLNAINWLTREVNLEILKRQRLQYVLNSLSIISTTPVLFVKPIESWSEGFFPVLTQFYDGRFGFFTKIFLFAIFLICYVFIQKIQNESERYTPINVRKKSWEQRLYGFKPIRWIVDRYTPAPHRKAYKHIDRLIKETNTPTTVEWFYVRRLTFSVLSILFFCTTFLVSHQVAKYNILHAPPSEVFLYGKVTDKEMAAAIEMSKLDRRIMEDVENGWTADELREAIYNNLPEPVNDAVVSKTLSRIMNKFSLLENEFFKWWELIIAVGVGVFFYWLPYLLMRFHRYMMGMELQNEVDQLHTIISIQSKMERVSVHMLLVWMERISYVFKPALQQCLLNYESGAMQALGQLKKDVTFLPFQRIVDRLLLAEEKIPIKEAFDDLQTDIEFYFELRKQKYEEVITAKGEWGRMIGMTPLYSLILFYLIVPFIYSSFIQFGEQFEKLYRI